MRRVSMWAVAAAWFLGSGMAAAQPVRVYLHLDSAGRCVSETPGLARVQQNKELVWEIVAVNKSGRACPPGTRVKLRFPPGLFGDLVASSEPPRASVDEARFSREKGDLDARMSPADKQDVQRLIQDAGPRRGPSAESPTFSSRLKARVPAAPGLYKYDVIVEGRVEDPPVKVTPP